MIPLATTDSDSLDFCPWCKHLYDPHVIVAQSYAWFGRPDGSVVEVPDGGVVWCPVPGCDCTSTWSLGLPPAQAGTNGSGTGT